jgi:hypothetical protein
MRRVASACGTGRKTETAPKPTEDLDAVKERGFVAMQRERPTPPH